MNNAESIEAKRRAALASVVASAVLTIAKLAAGLASGSLALLSESGHNLLDTGATILTYFAIRAAAKPADAEHPYGHGKIEAVAALVETGLLIVLAAAVLFEAARRVTGAEHASVDASPAAFAVLIVSIVVDLVRWRSLRKIARATRSDALAADALHFSSDLVASILVLAGLVAVRFGYTQGDAVSALGVAIFIAIAGFRLGRRTIDTLVDTAPPGLTERVRHTTQNVPGVVGVEKIRLRPVGSQVFGEVGIAVPRTMPLERVGALKDEVVAAIQSEMPEAAVTVDANARALDDETVIERVLLISASRRLPVHHITVQEVDGAKSVSLDVELDGHMRIAVAHELASSLETAIRAELGDEIEVETHIEPLAVQELAGHNAAPEQTKAIGLALVARASEGDTIFGIHSVRARVTRAGLVVNYHCHVDAALTVDAVHEAVDEVDRKVRNDFTAIVRIVGHAEPVQRN